MSDICLQLRNASYSYWGLIRTEETKDSALPMAEEDITKIVENRS